MKYCGLQNEDIQLHQKLDILKEMSAKNVVDIDS